MIINILSQFSNLLTEIAAKALHIGFLIRGGATIGKLYHAQGVIFGEALIEAYKIESRTAIYPRIVLSNKITSNTVWFNSAINTVARIHRDKDGLYYFNISRKLLWRAAKLNSNQDANGKIELQEVSNLIRQRLNELRSADKLHDLAKWEWFAREFSDALHSEPELIKSIGISLDVISWK
jgi:hypothetical protein